MDTHNIESSELFIPSSTDVGTFSHELQPDACFNLPNSPTQSILPVLESLYKLYQGPIRPLPFPPPLPRYLFFHVLYHPRDISRLSIRHLHEKHCEKVFKEEVHVDEFTSCYYRETNLKEILLLGTYREQSPNESINEFIKKLS